MALNPGSSNLGVYSKTLASLPVLTIIPAVCVWSLSQQKPVALTFGIEPALEKW